MIGYCAASGCSFQLRVDSGTGMPSRVERLRQLLLRIEIDVVALWATETASPATTPPPTLAATARQARLVSFRRCPAVRASDPCACKNPASSISTTGITHSNSSCAHFTSDSDFNRSISFSRNGNRTAASRAAYSSCASVNSKFQLLKRSDLSTASFR